MSSTASNDDAFSVSISSTRGSPLKIAVACRSPKGAKLNIIGIAIIPEGQEDEKPVAQYHYAGCVFDYDRNRFTMELDPMEEREYFIDLQRDVTFAYKVTIRDRISCEEKVVRGLREGIPVSEQQRPNEVVSTTYVLGQVVRCKPAARGYSVYNPEGTFVVSLEDGTENDFGIFDCSNINNTGCYSALGRDGHKLLAGKFETVVKWDSDTVAPEPDDPHAVHVRNMQTHQHGWLWRNQLLTITVPL